MPNLSPMHRTRKHKTHRGSDIRQSYAHLYSGAWRRYIKGFIKAHPLCMCEDCKGKVVPSQVVDHIIPHRGDINLFWDEGNHQALAKVCHDRKTMKEVRDRGAL